MKKIETERTVFILKQDHTLMDSALRMQDMLKDGWQHDFSVQLQYQTLVYLYRNATESPKPDWVKEEIKEMMRPSDQILNDAFRKGMEWERYESDKPDSNANIYFQAFVENLSPDTLKEDRELVKNHFFSVGILNGNTPDNVIVAFRRLCGMEVGNG